MWVRVGFRVGLRVCARVRVRARCLRLRGPRVVLLEAGGAAEVLVGLLALRVYARARGVPDALDARRTRGLRHLHGGWVGGVGLGLGLALGLALGLGLGRGGGDYGYGYGELGLLGLG